MLTSPECPAHGNYRTKKRHFVRSSLLQMDLHEFMEAFGHGKVDVDVADAGSVGNDQGRGDIGVIGHIVPVHEDQLVAQRDVVADPHVGGEAAAAEGFGVDGAVDQDGQLGRDGDAHRVEVLPHQDHLAGDRRIEDVLLGQDRHTQSIHRLISQIIVDFAQGQELPPDGHVEVDFFSHG